MLLSIAYFPPVSYFALIAKDFGLAPSGTRPSLINIEACEHYQKQSWRNRFMFYAADGPQFLNVPIVHGKDTYELPIRDIRVDYSTPWVLRTCRAISSAYESSAFFEHYSGGIFSILESRPETLFELDLRLIRFFLDKLGIEADIRLTDEYFPVASKTTPMPAGPYGDDYREIIPPKRPNTVLRDLKLEKPYFQVFARKHGFVSDLSIVDLLFNEGPESILYLKNL